MTKDEALRLALEALSPDPYRSEWVVALDMDKAITAIKEALAQPEQLREENRRLIDRIESIGVPVGVGGFATTTSAQPEQEPVGKFAKFTDGIWREVTAGSAGVSLYIAPQRTWVGLTDEEIDAIYELHHNQYGECESANLGYERAIEAKLKEKNT